MFDDVYSTEIRMVGVPGGSLRGGIDNYQAKFVAPVPLPASAVLMLGGLAGLIPLARRRRG
jgi:hypothetical protein